MEEKNYKNLKGSWKEMFDLCAFKKVNSHDNNRFKLYFNNELLKEFLDDQNNKRFRGLSGYSDLTARVHLRAEKAFYSKENGDISIQTIINEIHNAEYIVFDYKEENEDYRDHKLVIKLILSTLELNDTEKTFLSSVISTTFDDDSSTGTLAIANLPVCKKNPSHRKLEAWAKMSAEKYLMIHYSNVSNINVKNTFIFKLRYFLHDVYARYCI